MSSKRAAAGSSVGRQSKSTFSTAYFCYAASRASSHSRVVGSNKETDWHELLKYIICIGYVFRMATNKTASSLLRKESMKMTLPCESLAWIGKNSISLLWESHPSLFVCCVMQRLRYVKNSTLNVTSTSYTGTLMKNTRLGQLSGLILSRRKKHLCWHNSHFLSEKWWIQINGQNFIRVKFVIGTKEKALFWWRGIAEAGFVNFCKRLRRSQNRSNGD